LGEVVEFGAILGEVVHFPGLAVFGDDFEGALAEGAVALVFPSGDGAGAEGLAAEGGAKERPASGVRGMPLRWEGYVAPARSSMVGTMSITWAGSW
jgi:hypothetical protein